MLSLLYELSGVTLFCARRRPPLEFLRGVRVKGSGYSRIFRDLTASMGSEIWNLTASKLL